MESLMMVETEIWQILSDVSTDPNFQSPRRQPFLCRWPTSSTATSTVKRTTW